jgi:hypothetical protein
VWQREDGLPDEGGFLAGRPVDPECADGARALPTRSWVGEEWTACGSGFAGRRVPLPSPSCLDRDRDRGLWWTLAVGSGAAAEGAPVASRVTVEDPPPEPPPQPPSATMTSAATGTRTATALLVDPTPDTVAHLFGSIRIG